MKRTPKTIVIQIIQPPGISGLMFVLDALMHRDKTKMEIIQSMNIRESSAVHFFEATIYTAIL